MKFRKIYNSITEILSEKEHKKLLRFGLQNILFSILDLISIAYLIPAILLLLDKNQVQFYFKKLGLNAAYLSTNNLIVAVVFLLLFFLIKNMLQTRFNKKLYSFLYYLSHQLSMRLLDNYLNEDYLTFQEQNKGKIIQNVIQVSNDFSTSFLGSVLFLIGEGFTFTVILIVLLLINFKFTLIALGCVVVFALIVFFIKKKEIAIINNIYYTSHSKSNTELINILDGYIEIKNSGNQEEFLNKFKIHNQELNRATSQLAVSTVNYSKYLELFIIIGIAFLLLYNLLVVNEFNSLVLLSVLGALFIKIVPSLSKIMSSVTMIKSHYHTIDSLLGIKTKRTKPIVYNEFTTALEYKEIAFEYIQNLPVINNLSLKIERGKIIGIKGVTGSGKTTLLHIISGLLAPKKGTILFDGKQITGSYFFSFISYVSQQPFLFHGSLLENVTMRQNENIDYEYINYLIENLELKAVIDKLPNRLETVITHNTSKLSGGQKQRLALLRALYNKPKLLILDESTNQQNQVLEEKIYSFLQKIVSEQNMAIVTVSHNADIYPFCDMIYDIETVE
jgi:ABC-type bacteriocin/lantibiotic exporter with double-glycine peptidase domain